VRNLLERVAVVTGAASGIGLGIAEAMVGAGMKVMLVDIDEERLGRERARLAVAGAEVAAAVVDVGDPAQVEALADTVISRFGAVHVVCNNAGIIRPGRTWELSLQDWEDVLRVNLMGVVHGVRSFVPRILESADEGHVVNVASMAAVVPVVGIGPYNVSKHGVLALSEVLQAELASAGASIGVTVVMPGRVRTRLGQPTAEPDLNPSDDPQLQPGEIEPKQVGDQVIDALRSNQLHLFTHAERVSEAVARFARITGAAGS
jgi:NAD(P)-dependent dehydrogenase (short-subunit alcohol dehydrogenase family)